MVISSYLQWRPQRFNFFYLLYQCFQDSKETINNKKELTKSIKDERFKDEIELSYYDNSYVFFTQNAKFVKISLIPHLHFGKNETIKKVILLFMLIMQKVKTEAWDVKIKAFPHLGEEINFL